MVVSQLLKAWVFDFEGAIRSLAKGGLRYCRGLKSDLQNPRVYLGLWNLALFRISFCGSIDWCCQFHRIWSHLGKGMWVCL